MKKIKDKISKFFGSDGNYSSHKKLLLVGIAVLSGSVMAAYIFRADATEFTQGRDKDIVSFGYYHDTCEKFGGAKVVENSGTKRNLSVCQIDRSKSYWPENYQLADDLNGVAPFSKDGASYVLNSRQYNQAETCFWVKAINGNAVVNLRSFGNRDNSLHSDIQVTGLDYNRYCFVNTLLSDSELTSNAGLIVTSGTVRLSLISIEGGIEETTEPTLITVCRDGVEITINSSDRRTTDTNPPCEPSEPVEPGVKPWQSALDTSIQRAGGNKQVKVVLPQGHLGPRPGVALRNVTSQDADLRNGKYFLKRNVSGINFGAAGLDLNGYTAHDFTITVPGDVSVLITGNGEAGWFKVNNPNKRAADIIGAGSSMQYAHHFIVDGFTGDGIKVGRERKLRVHDGFLKLAVTPGTTNDKHYDGSQAHSGGNHTGPGGYIEQFERIVFDMDEGGVPAAVNAAVFSQAVASMKNVGNVLVLNPGGTVFVFRFLGDGPHTFTGPLQAIGRQAETTYLSGKRDLVPNAILYLDSPPGGQATVGEITLYNDVPGAEDHRYN